MKNRELYKIKSEIEMPIMAYIYELTATVGHSSAIGKRKTEHFGQR